MVEATRRTRNTGAALRPLPRSPFASLVVALVVSLASGVSEAKPRSEADIAVRRAKAAAGKGDYVGALAEFERALALAPTPQLHFNIAVCHHALMLAAASGDAAAIEHRDAAITAYRAYLDAAPDAEDRADVERIVAELTPPAPEDPPPAVDAPPPGPPPALREAVTRIDPTDEPEPEPEPEPTPAPAPIVSTRSPARVGPFLPVVLAHMGRLRDTDLVERLPLLGLGIRGGAFLGTRERVNLGAEFAVYGQPSDAKARHRLIDAHLAITTDFGIALGRGRRFELGVGGLLGVLYEGLSRDGTSELTCPTSRDGRVAQRGGLLLGPRLSALLLLGRRRNHELGLRITPALAVMGNGDAGDPPEGADGCGQTPFAEAGLPGGAALVTTVDLGYAPRF